MKPEFVECIVEMSEEFDEKEGFVTCEVSIHKDEIENFCTLVKEKTNVKLGKWVITECNTCVGYHGVGYVHCSIERTEYIMNYNYDDLLKIV